MSGGLDVRRQREDRAGRLSQSNCSATITDESQKEDVSTGFKPRPPSSAEAESFSKAAKKKKNSRRRRS